MTKLCRDCRFHRRYVGFSLCRNENARPKADVVGVDCIFCDSARASVGRCGPDAKLFEPRTKPWWKFWGRA